MKFLKTIFPLMLTLLILLTAVAGLQVATGLISLSKGQITYHDKDRQTGALYVADDEEILLFPWNVYDADNLIAYTALSDDDLDKYIPRYPELSEIPEISQGTPRERMDYLIFNTVSLIFPDYIPVFTSNFYGHLVFSPDNGISYLKDFAFTCAVDGKRYILNLAFTDRSLLYINCVPESPPTATQSHYERAGQDVDDMIGTLPVEFPPSEYYPEPTPETRYEEQEASAAEASPIEEQPNESSIEITLSNPLEQFIQRLMTTELTPYALIANYATVFKSITPDYQQLLLNDQLLLIFQENSCVLLYDPTTRQFSGFSLGM